MESIRRVFLPSFLGDVEFEAARSRSILGSRWPVVALGWFVVQSKWSKICFRNSKFVPKVRGYDEVGMSLSDE